MKKGKQTYYIKYFERNWNNIKNTWKGTKSLIWQYHVNDLSIKLNRANAFLFKMRKYVSFKIIRSIYFATFDSYLSYYCLVLAQNHSTFQPFVVLLEKAVKIINFQPRNSHTSSIFKQNSILKFQDKICSKNILFVSISLNNLTLSVFSRWFSFSSDQHNYETLSSTQGNLTKFFIKQIDMGSIQSL